MEFFNLHEFIRVKKKHAISTLNITHYGVFKYKDVHNSLNFMRTVEKPWVILPLDDSQVARRIVLRYVVKYFTYLLLGY